MNAIRTLTRTGIAVALLATGCGLVDAELDVPDACLVTHGLAMQGQTDGTTVGEVSRAYIQDKFDELLKDALSQDLHAEVYWKRATFRVESGPANFSLVEAAHMTAKAIDPAARLPEIEVVDCAAGTCPKQTLEMTVEAGSTVDILDYIRTGAVQFEVNLAGQLPAEPWTMGVDVCVAGKSRVQY
jgi:hypothetical protein